MDFAGDLTLITIAMILVLVSCFVFKTFWRSSALGKRIGNLSAAIMVVYFDLLFSENIFEPIAQQLLLLFTLGVSGTDLLYAKLTDSDHS